jgi:hypothetical protein
MNMSETIDGKVIRLVLPEGMQTRFRKASREINRSMAGQARELVAEFVRESEEKRAKERRPRK